jgi:transposase
MKLHRNAKSTPSSRFLLVRRVLSEQWTYAEAAEGFGVSVRTVAKWVRRFREGGVAALEDASSRPGVPPHQTPPAAVALIRLLRQQHGLPAWAIGRALHIPRSTVGAWLRRLGLVMRCCGARSRGRSVVPARQSGDQLTTYGRIADMKRSSRFDC